MKEDGMKISKRREGGRKKRGGRKGCEGEEKGKDVNGRKGRREE